MDLTSKKPDDFVICHHCGSPAIVILPDFDLKDENDESSLVCRYYIFCRSCYAIGPRGKDSDEAVQFWRSEGVD